MKLMIPHLKFSIVAFTLFIASIPCLAADYFFKDGDKIVIMGDSITEQHLYSTYLETWSLTRFPAWDMRFYNVGIGGDGAPGGNNRFRHDVLSYGATTMTVDFGMNDAGGNYTDFMKHLQGIADQARVANIRVAWCTPNACENPDDKLAMDTAGNRNLEKFSDGIRQTAAANGNALFVDQFHPFLAVIDKARPTNPKTRVGGGDQVHPGPPGQTLMAATILKGMSFPSLVASVEINAAFRKVCQNQNCTIEGLTFNADGKVEFKQTDQGLPFFPEEAKSILQWVPILEDLNDYHLKITGLKDGQYEVRLGGKKVADYSAAALGTGVNLAPAVLVAGPIADQVKAVRAAIQAKNSYFHDKIFRGVMLAGGVPEFMGITPEMVEAKREAVFKERMGKMPEFFEAIRKALAMQAHQVEVVPLMVVQASNAEDKADYPLKLAEIRVRDPFILADAASSTYFLYAQCGNRRNQDALGLGVEVYRSKDLLNWSQPELAFECPKSGFWGGVDIWAPEVHKFGDNYYMFVTFPGREKGRGTQIMRADRPQGPFKINVDGANTPPDQQCLDGTPWVDADGTHWLVYCNEWTQIGNGTVRAVRMSSDWTSRQGDSILLFQASEAPWVRPLNPGRNEYVTDGPFFYRTKGGKLLMIWSSFRKGGNYAVGVARSDSGTVKGPWRHSPDVLYGEDGGHGMIFRDLSGNLLLVLHQPNGGSRERAQLLKLKEEDDHLVVVRD